jgi:phenylalanyl-tRNA synthetase alpha chain
LQMIAPAAYEDVLLVCPGLTYRRDAIDRLHVGEPHQLDLWRLKRGQLRREDLERMIEIVATAMLPGVPLRLDPASHPYTLDGREVHGRVDDSWVEILECGLAHPAILESAGLSSEAYSGLAMGIGLDRMLMLRKGIKDIRALRSSDPRIAQQMIDLEPYRAVSLQPPVVRDLSVAVSAQVTAEELGDRVRLALGDASQSVEQITIVAETGYEELSDVARRRLGMTPAQKNLLVRVVIRDLDRTLTAAEGNQLRDEIYAVIHEGLVKTWAARR